MIYGILLVFLAACSGAPPASQPNCSAGGEVCIEVRAEEPIGWGEPVTVFITVTSTKDVSGLDVNLTTSPNSIVVQAASGEEPGTVTQTDPSQVNWLVDVQGNQPVTFTRLLSLPPEEGLFEMRASAETASLRAEDMITILMRLQGGTVYLPGTPIPILEAPEASGTPAYPPPVIQITLPYPPPATPAPQQMGTPYP